MENKISFVAGTAFYTAEEGQGKIRLNYTYATPELINQGIKVLCELIRSLQIKAGGIRIPGTREVMPIV